jgi:hypothetical protein
MQHLPAEQQRFEEYFLWSRVPSLGRKKAADELEKDAEGDYVHPSTQRHWWTWQMASAPDRLQYLMERDF